MKATERYSSQQLTFFDPLKDGASKQSGVFQSVVDFFSSKKEDERSSMGNSHNEDCDEIAETTVVNTFTNPTIRLQRPSSLSVDNAYKNKEFIQGSEVEVRLRNISAMLREFPKRIVPKYPSPTKDYHSMSENSSENLKQYWMPDKHCHECYECGDRFTTFRRRHHCRICGHIFCSRCCYQFIAGAVVDHAAAGMLRSCTYCYSLLMSYTKTTASTAALTSVKSSFQHLNDHDGLTEDLNSSFNLPDVFNTSLTLPHQRPGRSRSLISIRASPSEDTITSPMMLDNQIYKSPYSVFDVTPGVHQDSRQGEVKFAKGSVQLHELWANISDDKDGLEFRDHRYRLRKFTQSVTGIELVDWLVMRGITVTRPQGCAIGQALLDAEWIKSVVDDRVFHDEYCLYQHGSNAIESCSYYKSSGLVEQSTPIKPQRRPSRPSRPSSEPSLDNEPYWVREISNEEEDNSDDGLHFWSPVQPSYKLLDGGFTMSSEESTSSINSLSSYVEIDNAHSIIKYKRPSNRLSGELSPRLEAGLQQPKFVDESVMTISAEYIRSFLTWHATYLSKSWFSPKVGWREKEVSHLPQHIKATFYRLKRLYFQYAMKFLRQLFTRDQLDISWADIIVPLAKEICETVTPNSDLNMEICHYVHVKKLLDNPPEDSRLFWGVVFSQNVVHNMMSSRIDNPVIMLLATPLEYQRGDYKLSSLDPIVRQESEFFKHLVSRIVSRSPDIVISQCSVSHEARRLMLDAGITLLINVKQPVMERLSRCTGADIAGSIDQLKIARLGTCGRFRVARHYDGKRSVMCSDGIEKGNVNNGATTNAYKTLIYVDGCNPSTGCSIILRDKPNYNNRQADYESRQQLARVKSALLFLVRIMYHAKLEISYLLDQQDVSASIPRKKRRQKSTDVDCWKDYSSGTSESEVQSGEESSFAIPSRCSGSDDNTVTSEFITATDHTPGSCSNSPIFLPSCNASPLLSFNSSQGNPSEDVAANSSNKTFSNHLQSTLLSISPMIQPVVPFLLSESGANSPLRTYLPDELFWSGSFQCEPSHKHGFSSRLRHRTQSIDRMYAVHDDEGVGMRSRSGTMDSVHDNMWRPHNSQEDLVLTVEVESSAPNMWHEVKQEVARPSKSGHQHSSSYLSPKGLFSKDDLFDWERTIMCDVLQSSSQSSSSHLLSTPPPSSQPLQPPSTQPPSTQPPSTQPPSTQPPSTQPPSTKPPSTQPLSTKPPSNQPSSTQPPSTQPPFTQSPTTRPPPTPKAPKFEKMGWKTPDHVFLTTPLSKPASSETTKDMIASFRARGSNLRVERTEPTPACKDGGEKKEPEILGGDPSPLDCLEPHNHQHIYVLFSSYSLQSPNAPYPCVIPWAVDIDYYHGNDITIGGFLERYCFRPSYQCPSPTCKRPMLEHVRSFVHGNTAMNIILKELSKPVASPHILSWCWNPATKTSTDLKPLSEDGWSMSFAKYLELRLQTYPLRNICGFSPFVSFQYFIYKDIVAAFKCYEVPVYDIFLPSTKVTFNTPTNWMTLDTNHSTFYGVCVDKMNELSKVGYEAMDSIYDMLMEVKSSVVESTTESEGVTRETHFDELLSLYQEERCQLRDTADDIHLILLSIRKSQISDEEASNQQPTKSTDGLVVNTEESSTLSSSLLELACLICKLVHTWNNRINTVLEQDRSSRRGSKAVLYFNPPVALSPTDASRPKRSPNMMPLQEDQAEVEMVTSTNEEHRKVVYSSQHNADQELCDSVVSGYDETARFSDKNNLGQKNVGVSGSMAIPGTGEHTHPSSGGGATPGNGNGATPSTGATPGGVSIPGTSGKRYSRTTSSISMRSILTHLRQSANVHVASPFQADEHYLLHDTLPAGHVVRDSEPSSIIAYAMSTPAYQRFITKAALRDDQSTTGDEMLFVETDGTTSNPSVEATPTNSPSHTSPHLELQFSDPTTKFYCKIYFAMEFKELRDQLVESEDAYMGSLARCARWAARGGKSGSAFHKTLDDRLVIKQMSRFELQSFLDVAPSYMSHITTAVNNKTPTTLSKILGVYRVSFRNNTTNRSFKQDLLIVENLFYKRNIQQVFDLKGSVRNRHVKTEYDTAPNTSASNLISGEKSVTNQNDLVLLDENLLSIMKDHPLYVHQHSKLIIKKALHNDATFLSNHLIIDYSLLVGVDGDSKEIVLGIIDYMRTFTWDKKLEMVVKSYGMIGIQGTRSMPTVVSPQLYKTRFCEAMDRYFQAVPDRWYGLQAYDVQ